MTATATAYNDRAAASDPPYATWLICLRTARGYDTTVRVLGVVWFLTLALVVARKVVAQATVLSIADFTPAEWAGLLASACMLLFYLVICWAMLVRSSPMARTNGILPSLVAFVGTYLPWTVVMFAPGEASAAQHVASATLCAVGAISMVVVVCYLGRSFSIVPQATTLVQAGPYSIVRNPLYLVEEIALLGTLLQYYSTLTLSLFLAHGAFQVLRILYEETLLRRTFAEYDQYAASTSRLIPYVW